MLNRIPIAGIILSGVLLTSVSDGEINTPASPQDYVVHVWQTDDGLPQNWVSSIAQTPDGYLWIGTRYGGLARFDGVRFVGFNQQNTPELKDVQVEHLSVDETGALWIIMGNESVTAMRDGRFRLYRWPRSNPRLRAERVLTVRSNMVLFAGEFPYLAQLDPSAGTNGWEVFDPRPSIVPRPETFELDRNGTIWFITQNLHLLGRFEGGEFERMRTLPGLPQSTVTALALSATRQLWISTPQHLAFWNGDSFEDRTPTNGVAPNDICSIAFSGDGGVWVLERNRLRKWLDGKWVAEAQPWQLEVDVPPDPLQLQLYGDAQGGAWLISYGHGLWHIKSDGTSHHLTESDGLPSLFITCWFQDREGDIWIGTAGGGIARIRESIFRVFGEAQGLPGKVVRSVCVDDEGKLWAGTLAGGLACLRNGRFARVPLPAVDSSPVESITAVPGVNDSLWIGSLNHGLMRLQSGTVTRVAATESVGNSIRVLYTDHQGQLWIGGLVNLFRLADGELKQFHAADGFVNAHAIGALAEDAAGALWIGTGPGELWRFKDGQFTCFDPPVEWPSVRFSALLPDTNGIVWVGTLGGGLLRFQNGTFTRCTVENGLPDDNISQLLDSGDGYIWAGTYAGIFRCSKSDVATVLNGTASHVPCRVYGRFEGLPALECSSGFQPACWRSDDGQLWFATANGIVSVNPANIKPNRLPPIVLIEELLVDGKSHALPEERQGFHSSVPPASALEIRPGRHYLQFRFTGLNFAAPDGVRFRVKLEGAEEKWRDIGGQRLAGYGPLSPGSYRFRVLACNNDGVWNEKGAALAFTVLPYFWETWWFKVSLGMAGCTALGLAVGIAQRRRYRRKLGRLEREQEMERERARIARDLHDDIGTSLTQISMLSALIDRERPLVDASAKLTQQIRARSRETVTALNEIVWAVNPKNDSLNETVGHLGNFAEQFFRNSGIRCRLDFPVQLPDAPLPFGNASQPVSRLQGGDQ